VGAARHRSRSCMTSTTSRIRGSAADTKDTRAGRGGEGRGSGIHLVQPLHVAWAAREGGGEDDAAACGRRVGVADGCVLDAAVAVRTHGLLVADHLLEALAFHGGEHVHDVLLRPSTRASAKPWPHTGMSFQHGGEPPRVAPSLRAVTWKSLPPWWRCMLLHGP